MTLRLLSTAASISDRAFQGIAWLRFGRHLYHSRSAIYIIVILLHCIVSDREEFTKPEVLLNFQTKQSKSNPFHRR